MSETPKIKHFLRQIIEEDLAAGKFSEVVTRFPPEPNGYLHIGHAKSICLNFGLSQEYGGRTHLRFDDTNPTTEDMEFVQSIQNDVRWLGFDWQDHLYFASDYFEDLYQFAVKLIRDGKAYVDSCNLEEIRAMRGTVTEPGQPSPYRNRSVEENLDLFARMRAGEFADGAHVLRAKIDMASANMKMRDPLLYRIRHAHHYRSGDAWCIYPMYDFAHCLSDALESITHSICTLEFENNRDLYDWVIEHCDPPAKPKQFEFARLNINYTVMSKRKLMTLVKEKHVSGWDDPRMPTIAGMRRRGYPALAIRNFCEQIGVAKANSMVDFSQLEYCIRDVLNYEAPRAMAITRPLKLILETYREGQSESLEAALFPDEIGKPGTRKMSFSKTLYIEADDFMENPTKNFHRLVPGGEVRLKNAYTIKCERVEKDANGQITALICSHDPNTLGKAPEGRKVKGIIHWVDAQTAVPAEFRVYDRLFLDERPDTVGEFKDSLNPDSLVVLNGFVEASLAKVDAGSHFQFERQGYYFADPKDHSAKKLVFNRTVSLKDGFNKAASEEINTPAKVEEVQSVVKARTYEEVLATKAENQVPFFQTFHNDYGLSVDDADTLSATPELAQFYQTMLTSGAGRDAAAKWVVNELMRILKDIALAALPFDASKASALVQLLEKGTISSKIAKEILSEMVETGQDPNAILETKGLKQINDPQAIRALIEPLLQQNAEKVQAYRDGKDKLYGFFVGQAMKASGGKANPEILNQVLTAMLSAS
ncbi:MAG: glutamine--tRNA ligase/YqeY domain fusion protein [Acidobacteria bacterium]|nr:glutamine--tRNA ligase/YqeY domain fusion protein [Acidobacteriota bacterium]MCB9397684.1 glutamine--tRNA ligase/YqeY domain fusion protein [Acidobacteriota bacterium]